MDFLKNLKTWHKITAIVVASLLLIVVVVVLVGFQKIKITEDFSATVFLGNMGDKEAGRVMEVAKTELYEKQKYPFARDAFETVLRYNKTKYRDDALMWIGLTYMAEGEFGEACTRFDKVTRDYPKGDVIEDHKLGAPLTAELEKLYKAQPFDYPAVTSYLRVLNDASVPSYPELEKKLNSYLETPINMSSEYAHEKELTFAVKKTAAEDAKKEAMFHAKGVLPGKVTVMLKKKVNFGKVIGDEQLEEIIADNMVYGDRLESIKKSTSDGLSGLELDAYKKKKLEESKMLYGDLPEDWAFALTSIEQEEGWAASATVVGGIEGLTLRQILEEAEINPTTGKPVR